MLTVRELLRDLDVHVRAGAESLDAPVRWVHISELEDPTPWLSGGELLLTTGLQLNDEATQRDFVGRLADHNLAGLGFGAGFAHETVPPAMLEAAEQRGFPIVEIPYEVPFIAVTEQAFSRLVNEQYAVLRRAISAHERLERLLLSQRGLDAVAGALSSLIGAAVVILDGRGEPRVRRAFREPLEDEAVEALALEVRDRMRAGERRSFVPGQTELAGRGLALPVAPEESSGVPQAWLVAVKEQGGLTEFDRLVLHQAVTIVALELLRRRVAEDTERRLAGDVLSAMVSGELAGPELVRRLEPFGLARQVAALVIARPQPGRSGLLAGEHALASALRAEAVDGLVASTGDWICALLPGGDDDELFALTQRIGTRVQEELGVPVRAGAGRPVEGAQGRRSFHEARCALEARQLTRTNGNGNGVGDLQGPRELPAAALAPGGRRPQALLRLRPRSDRDQRRRLRRRADALARGVHRGERPVGARRQAPVLPPPHPALPRAQGGGADRARPVQRAGPHRVLARAARARARHVNPTRRRHP